MEGGVLPIQGPPGAGKTYTAARVIVNEVPGIREETDNGEVHTALLLNRVRHY